MCYNSVRQPLLVGTAGSDRDSINSNVANFVGYIAPSTIIDRLPKVSDRSRSTGVEVQASSFLSGGRGTFYASFSTTIPWLLKL